jgi:hypothetical protein
MARQVVTENPIINSRSASSAAQCVSIPGQKIYPHRHSDEKAVDAWAKRGCLNRKDQKE